MALPRLARLIMTQASAVLQQRLTYGQHQRACPLLIDQSAGSYDSLKRKRVRPPTENRPNDKECSFRGVLLYGVSTRHSTRSTKISVRGP
jgi:hypothetical protein